MDSNVANSMTKNVYFVEPQDSTKDAFELMKRHQFRHFPVLQNHRVVGVLTQLDIYLCSDTDKKGAIVVPDLKVEEVMTRHPITCNKDSRISDVARVMVDRKIDCLPVIDQGGELVGMITSSDLLEILSLDPSSREAQVIPFDFQVFHRSHLIDGSIA